MRYRTVATGGTFDHFHKGHLALLSRSFEAGDKVVIGVTSDAFAAREGKSPNQPYDERVSELESAIRSYFPGREYLIAKLDDYFGPGIASPEVQAIVVTRETASRVPIANSLREKKGYSPLEVIVVDYVLAEDQKPISSTRIRRGEIDKEGRLLSKRGAKPPMNPERD
ncbi:MAG: phosphopantetheine adenylyltransferase [Thaumarchaeota archaeon]|nr:phosphopantetheine adenylyltransferase [Nitrososphaerota archaeon]